MTSLGQKLRERLAESKKLQTQVREAALKERRKNAVVFAREKEKVKFQGKLKRLRQREAERKTLTKSASQFLTAAGKRIDVTRAVGTTKRKSLKRKKSGKKIKKRKTRRITRRRTAQRRSPPRRSPPQSFDFI